MAIDEGQYESKYAHLLQPIRDLASNWNIDIAHDLEEYLSDLENVSFALDGLAQPLNFAEAALLIQGSACIYSRKVEYLYSLVYQSLDFLIAKNKKTQNSSVDTNGADNDALPDVEPEFLCLDDIPEADGIDIIDDDDDRISSRTPLRSSTIGNRRGPHRIAPIFSIMMDASRSGGSSEMFDESEGGVGVEGRGNGMSDVGMGGNKRTDFRMNTAAIHRSGALVLDDPDNIDDFLRVRGSSSSDSHNYGGEVDSIDLDSSARATAEDAPSRADLSASQLAPEPFDGGGGDDSDVDTLPDDHDIDNDNADPNPTMTGILSEFRNSVNSITNTTHEITHDKAQPATVSDRKLRQTRQKQVEDLWAMLDPHEAPRVKSKPFVRGKTFRMPEELNLNKKSKPRERASSASSSSSVPSPCFFSFPFPSSSTLSPPAIPMKGTAFPEFMYLYQQDVKRRQAELKSSNTRASEDWTGLHDAHSERHIGHDADDDDDGAGADVWSDGEEDGLPIPTYTFEGPTLERTNSALDTQSLFEHNGDDDNGFVPPLPFEAEPEAQTYEDLCRKHIEKYLASANQFVQETTLSRRIKDWTDKITPKLCEQIGRPVFDIQAYGADLLQNMSTETDTLKQQQSPPHTNNSEPDDEPRQKTRREKGKDVSGHEDDLVVSFDKLTVGAEHFEVCRRFAAILQLCNNGNVELVTSRQVDDVGFVLLTTKGKYDIASYRAPSLASEHGQGEVTEDQAVPLGHSSGPANSDNGGKRGGKNKGRGSRAKEHIQSEDETQDNNSDVESDEESDSDTASKRKNNKRKETSKTTGKRDRGRSAGKENAPNGHIASPPSAHKDIRDIHVDRGRGKRRAAKSNSFRYQEDE